MKKIIFLLLLVLTMISCEDNEPFIEPTLVNVKELVEELINVEELCITYTYKVPHFYSPHFDMELTCDSTYTLKTININDFKDKITKTFVTITDEETLYSYDLYTEKEYKYTKKQ